MQIGALDRDTLLDLTVNAIPLGILAFFFVLFLVNNPFGLQQPVYVYLQMGIVGLSFVFLSILSYLAGKAVVKDERSRADLDEETAPVVDEAGEERPAVEDEGSGESVAMAVDEGESGDTADRSGQSDGEDDEEAGDVSDTEEDAGDADESDDDEDE